MVRSSIDVKMPVVRFALWPKLSGVAIKGCVQKSVQSRLISAFTFKSCILKMAISFFFVRSISGPGTGRDIIQCFPCE